MDEIFFLQQKGEEKIFFKSFFEAVIEVSWGLKATSQEYLDDRRYKQTLLVSQVEVMSLVLKLVTHIN